MNFNAPRIHSGVGTLLILSAIGGWFAQQAVAQTYPSGPIRIIVPYAAGGLADALARITGARVAEAMDQPVT